jgi:hypothetical protein
VQGRREKRSDERAGAVLARSVLHSPADIDAAAPGTVACEDAGPAILGCRARRAKRRSLAPRIRTLTRAGYGCHLVFLWLPSADLAVARVADRVRLGGHAVPEQTIRRRYRSGLRNFFALYRPLTTTWRMYDNSTHELRLLASGTGTETRVVNDRGLWERIGAEAEDEG